MTITRRTVLQVSTAAMVVFAVPLSAAEPQGEPQASRQSQADDYTRYELLDPASASFRIVYEVTATTPGARYFWNPIRKGSLASNESVSDPTNGQALKFIEVSGAEAKANGLGNADLDTRYIQIELPRPVPKEGEIRLLIDKTYKDEKSYFVEEKTGFIVYSRSLGIKRNSVVLPAGYEIVSCNFPSQVASEPGTGGARLRLSFMNIGPDAVSYVVKARRMK